MASNKSGGTSKSKKTVMASITNGEYEHLPRWQRISIYTIVAVGIVVGSLILLVIVIGFIQGIFTSSPQSSWGDCSVADCSGLNEFPSQ